MNFTILFGSLEIFVLFLAAVATLYVYFRDKQLKRVDAAKILMSEIREIERKVRRMQTLFAEKRYYEFNEITEHFSWHTLRITLKSKLSTQQYEQISDFYDGAVQIDREALRLRAVTEKAYEFKMNAVQAKIIDYIFAHYTESDFAAKYQHFMETFDGEVLLAGSRHELSQRSLDYTQKLLTGFKPISNQPVFGQLEQISHPKILWLMR